MTIFGTLRPKQNNPVIWLRHNEKNKHLATPLSLYFLDMLVMDLFPIYLIQNHYFCFYFFTFAFYFVPSLGKRLREGGQIRSCFQFLRNNISEDNISQDKSKQSITLDLEFETNVQLSSNPRSDRPLRMRHSHILRNSINSRPKTFVWLSWDFLGK